MTDFWQGLIAHERLCNAARSKFYRERKKGDVVSITGIRKWLAARYPEASEADLTEAMNQATNCLRPRGMKL